VADPAHPDQQHVRADQRDQDDRDKHDVPQQHLAEVHHVEERTHADRVERVLAVGGDPLGVEVLLGQVPGEALHDRGPEGHHAGDPGQRPAPAPGGHPELAPQVNNHERHEQLDAPQVRAVEEMADGIGVPPVGAADRDDQAGDDGQAQRGQRRHPEHVDPGGNVGRLPVGQQFLRRKGPQRPPPGPCGPHPGVGVLTHGARHRLAARGGLVRRGQGAVPVREGQQQRRAEDRHHDGDHHQVRDRDLEDRPVQIGAWLIQVNGQRAWVGQQRRIHTVLQCP
jgi:hypothetical protein